MALAAHTHTLTQVWPKNTTIQVGMNRDPSPESINQSPSTFSRLAMPWLREAAVWLSKAEVWLSEAEVWLSKAEVWLSEAAVWLSEAEVWLRKAAVSQPARGPDCRGAFRWRRQVAHNGVRWDFGTICFRSELPLLWVFSSLSPLLWATSSLRCISSCYFLAERLLVWITSCILLSELPLLLSTSSVRYLFFALLLLSANSSLGYIFSQPSLLWATAFWANSSLPSYPELHHLCSNTDKQPPVAFPHAIPREWQPELLLQTRAHFPDRIFEMWSKIAVILALLIELSPQYRALLSSSFPRQRPALANAQTLPSQKPFRSLQFLSSGNSHAHVRALLNARSLLQWSIASTSQTIVMLSVQESLWTACYSLTTVRNSDVSQLNLCS
jgi:hypothetical protein